MQEQELFYDLREPVNPGLFVAAALSAYDSDPSVIEDPEIGILNFYLKVWDSEDDSIPFDFIKVESELCTDKSFNDREKFYPVTKGSEQELSFYSPQMKCPKERQDIWGTIDTAAA